ncbi:MAG: hypothetical protein JXR70_06485 [Spirochaetales bacterium]|nr:hypothetical protein [Spirochaetales bacterium]
MKKLLLLIMAIVVILSCTINNEALGSVKNEALGSIRLKFAESLSKSHEPGISYEIEKLGIKGLGPLSANFYEELSKDETEFVQNELIIGEWKITIDAYNAQGDLVGSGSTLVFVQANAVSEASLVIHQINGLGLFQVIVNFPKTNNIVYYAQGELFSEENDSIPINFSLYGDFLMTDDINLPPGSYGLEIKIYGGNINPQNLVLARYEAVQIASNKKTTAQYIYSQESGSMELTVGSDLPQQVVMEFNNVQNELGVDQIMNVEALIDRPVDSYNWYINSESVDGFYQNSILISGSDFSVGSVNWVDLVIKIGSYKYSKGFYFMVREAIVVNPPVSDSKRLEALVVNHTSTNAQNIPDEFIAKIKTDYTIHIAGQSHAGQLASFGMRELSRNNGDRYLYNERTTQKSIPYHSDTEINIIRGLPFSSAADQEERFDNEWFVRPHHYFGGTINNVNWDRSQGPYRIEEYLDDNYAKYLSGEAPLVNVAMLIFCAEFANIWSGIENYLEGYLSAMENLEKMYSAEGSKGRDKATAVQFIYSTNHTQHRNHPYGSGETQYADEKGALVWRVNQVIREYAVANKKILYDFGDLDSWGLTNGQGSTMSDFDRNGVWELSKPITHDIKFYGNIETIQFYPAHDVWGPYTFQNVEGFTNNNYHTRVEHAELKAAAFWYLMAKIAGWEE